MTKRNDSSASFLTALKRAPNAAATIVIRFYRAVLSPSDGALRFLPFYPKPSCIFHPTCSAYALECFRKYGFFDALKKSAGRVSRCHPGNEPSIDHP